MGTKITYWLVIVLALTFCIKGYYASAGEVPVSIAKNVAINLYSERAQDAGPNISISQIIEEKEKGETVFYVMIYSGKGFAIISADDIVQPILGYSFESIYDKNNHSPAFEFYILKRFRKQIYAAKQVKLAPDDETIQDWSKFSVSPSSFQPESVQSAFPLISTLWGQRLYYNTLCPPDAGDTISGHVPVGCVATAMAQVLNYWQHPWHGVGSHSYTPEGHPEYGVQSADFSNTIYNFDNMPDTVSDFSNDLEELMYHCAVSVNMNFGPDGSGAWGWDDVDDISDVLRNNFYFNDATDGIRRSTYSTTWLDKMKENLDAKRPVIYAAEDNQEDVGHAWILDAYHEGDMFHCNWGWSGSDNGYFSIDDFTLPDGSLTFDTYEIACVKIYPRADHINGTYTNAGSPYYLNFDYIVDPGNQLIIEPGVELIFTGRYKLEISGRLESIGTITDSIKFTSELPEIGMRGVRFSNLNDYSADSSKLLFCSFNNGKGGYNGLPYNLESLKGGAIYCENSSKVLIANSTIKNSSARFGGGIACYDTSNIRIENCVISNDSAAMGGGIFLSYSNAILNNNIIENNESPSSNGGGVFVQDCNPVFTADTIRDNYAGFGGGMGFNNSTAILNNVIIQNNEARVDAGGIYTMESGIELNDVELYLNVADSLGGAVLCYSNSPMQFNRVRISHNMSPVGAAITIVDATPTLTNVTISENIANPDQQAIYIKDGGINIENSILWLNIPDQIDTTGVCVVNPSYSIIDGGDWPGVGVIDKNPMFVTPIDRNYQLSWGDYPMPDGDKSPAIDTGNPSSPNDSDGTPADMGAIPFEQTYTAISGGDINGTLSCAGSPYYVFGNLTIPSGDELIIEPCVHIMFRGDYSLRVEGRLLAEGLAGNKITFAPCDTIECWQGIKFINTNYNSLDSSKMVNCRITYGSVDPGGPTGNNQGGAIYMKQSSNVLIKNCLMNNNYAANAGGAMYFEGSLPAIIDNTFRNNSSPRGGAISFIWGTPVIHGGFIENNEAEYGGACFLNGSNPTFSGVTIRHNIAKYGGAIYMYGGCTPVFDPLNLCNIYGNYAGAVGLDFCTTSWWGSPITINVDTFGVLNPNKHFIYPEDIYTLNIQHAIIEQTSEDLYISMSGSDDNIGTNPAEPLKTMHMAMMKIMANEADTAIIYLANGTYSEGATGEMMPINWRGDVSLIGESMSMTTIYGENKNQLLYCYDDSNFYINKIDFQGGYAEDGGAIYLDHYSSPSMSNIRIQDNFVSGDGGGLFCNDHSSPSLDTVIISNNFAEGGGGGIYLLNNSNPVFRTVTISNNSANYTGGGLRSYLYCDFIMDDVTITSNAAAHGGGMMIDFYSNLTISNSQIIHNNAISYSGYPAYGGGVRVTYGSAANFENVEIFSNTSDYKGGGIDCSADIEFRNGKIISNYAQNSGGGLHISGGNNQKFINTEICDNTADDYSGAAVYASSSSTEFINVTISGNTAVNDYASLVYCYNANPTFTNSILWDNTPDLIDVYSGSVAAEYSNIEGSWPGIGNIDSDPLYTNAATGDFTLQETSLSIDAGTPDTTGMNLPLFDLAGNPRISNGIIDMGAYEYLNHGEDVQLDITVFLEGPFNGTDMDPSINSGLPMEQPYAVAPWNYSGTENVVSVPANVVDWILIELRDAPNAPSATPSTIIARRAGFLMNDGSVVDLDGTSYLMFNDISLDNSMYIIIWHRNHLGIMSDIGLPLAGLTSINFPISDATIYNSSIGGYKELASGIWGMVGGDGNADGTINTDDQTTVWSTEAGSNGYLNGDFNMNSQTDNKDKNDIWFNNDGNSSQIPD